MTPHAALLNLIEAFGFWLKHALPGWSVSRAAIERTTDGTLHPSFVLYQDGVPVRVYKTPTDALARIGDDRLTNEYVSLVSGTNEGQQSDHYPSSEL